MQEVSACVELIYRETLIQLLLLEEQWRWMDAGKGKRSWQDVMRALDRSVLIL